MGTYQIPTEVPMSIGAKGDAFKDLPVRKIIQDNAEIGKDTRVGHSGQSPLRSPLSTLHSSCYDSCMKIAIDARMMGAQNTRGIGRYTEEIIRAMLTQLPAEHRLILLERHPESSPFTHPSVSHLKADIPWYGFAEQWRMPSIIQKSGADLLFVPHWNISWFCKIPRITCIHDLILLEEPNSAHASTRGFFTRWIKRLGHRLILHRALTTSRSILVPTEYTKSRIKHFYPNIKTPIIVTGEGMPTLREEIWQDANQEHPYLLMVGSAYPHKNHQAILSPWKKIRSEYPNLELHIVGEKDVFMKRLMDTVSHERLDGIRFLGKVSDEALKDEYTQALALVFPSRHEGFGLPPLEALAYGIPVIAARASCLPEVLGERGATFFNPSDRDAIIQSIRDLLEDPGGARESARNGARQLAKTHQWNKAGERTLKAFFQ